MYPTCEFISWQTCTSIITNVFNPHFPQNHQRHHSDLGFCRIIKSSSLSLDKPSSVMIIIIRINSQIMDTILCRSVTKNLTAYRFNSAGWGLDDMKREIHSFPTMYIIGGGKWGRNGSKLRFSEKKWSKNSFFEGHKSGSTDFGGVWHPYFWRYR